MLKKVAPNKLLYLAIILWLFFFALNSGTYFNLGSLFFPILTLVLYNVAFLIGVKLYRKPLVILKLSKTLKPKDSYFIFITFILGSIGVLLRFYQRVFIQKLLSTENSFESRLLLLEAGSNPGILSLVSALLFPFSFISLAYATFYFKSISKTRYFLLFIFGTYPIVDSIFYQGRLAIVLYSLMLVLVIVFQTSLKSNKLDNLIILKAKNLVLFSFPRYFSKAKLIFLSTLIIGLFLTVSINMMSQRYAKYNFEKHLAYIEYHQENKFDEDLLELIKTSENPYYHLSKYSLIHYMTHGVMEYIKMVNHVGNPLGTYYGQYEFNVYFKALKVLGLPISSYNELTKVQKRTGVYTTFWGDFYIDFGLIGVLLMVIIGYLVKKNYTKAVSGNGISILFYSYFGVVILGSPFINLLSGSVIYYFNALLISSLIYRYLPNKIFVFR